MRQQVNTGNKNFNEIGDKFFVLGHMNIGVEAAFDGDKIVIQILVR